MRNLLFWIPSQVVFVAKDSLIATWRSLAHSEGGPTAEALKVVMESRFSVSILHPGKKVSSSPVLLCTLSFVAAAAKSLQSCPTLCDPIDRSPPGSPVPGILQARTLERAAISFSNAWQWKVKVKSLSCVWPSAIPWTTAFQAPQSMGFSRQEYWSVPLPSPLSSVTTSKIIVLFKEHPFY